MARWRGKSSSSEQEPSRPELVVPGAIRSPDEADVLVVVLSITDSTLTLQADGSELGRWDSADVEIRPIDTTSFEFVAEGDRLIFLPDDPAAFAIVPIAGGSSTEQSRRARRRSKKKSDDGAAPTRPSDPAPRADPPKPTPVAKSTKPPRIRRRMKSGRKHVGSGKTPAPRAQGTSNEKKDGVWIRMLDKGRKYDMFGLDRVPIDEDLRGKPHQHTWDHRVAATSGPGKHICTLCGKIRL